MKRLGIAAVIIGVTGIIVFLAPYIGYILFMMSNNARVDFYGRIVDQNSNPIGGARIVVQIHAVPTLLTPEISTIDLVSDSNGCFSIERETGTILYVYSIDKFGYEVSGRETRSFNYGHHYGTSHIADPKKPDLFRVWKKGVTEPLIKNRIEFKPLNKTNYSIDLISGKFSNYTNQIADFWFNISSDGKGSRGIWSLLLIASSGGFIETSDTYLYMAPENSYDTRLEWNLLGSRAHKKVYLASRNRRIYASMEIEVYNYGGGKWRIIFDYTANPNGSRNLEYDATKRLQVEK